MTPPSFPSKIPSEASLFNQHLILFFSFVNTSLLSGNIMPADQEIHKLNTNFALKQRIINDD